MQTRNMLQFYKLLSFHPHPTKLYLGQRRDENNFYCVRGMCFQNIAKDTLKASLDIPVSH